MKHIVIDFEMQHGEMQLLQSAPNVYQTEIIEIGGYAERRIRIRQ